MSRKCWILFIILCIVAISIPAVRIVNAAPVVTTISKKAKTEAWRQASCDERLLPETGGVKTFRIDSHYDLVAFPCLKGAYNFAYVFLVVSRRVPHVARLAMFETWDAKTKSVASTAALTIRDFPRDDQSARVLRSFHKTRGVADCGEIGEWHWRNTAFVLNRYWIKNDCDGQAFEPTKKWLVFENRPRGNGR